MPEWLSQSFSASDMPTISVLTVRLSVAFLFGCLAAATHWCTPPSTRRADRSLLATLVNLAILVAVVTCVLGDNVARAFSLAGVLAIVRFRAMVEDTRDTRFVIHSVVSGLAIGGGYFWEPAIATPLVMLAAWWFRPGLTAPPPPHGMLVVRWASALPIGDQIETVLRAHVLEHHLVGMSATRGGFELEASYSMLLPNAETAHKVITKVGALNGMKRVKIKRS
jgi:hypothetical protein